MNIKINSYTSQALYMAKSNERGSKSYGDGKAASEVSSSTKLYNAMNGRTR